jgi:hypothetical protein
MCVIRIKTKKKEKIMSIPSIKSTQYSSVAYSHGKQEKPVSIWKKVAAIAASILMFSTPAAASKTEFQYNICTDTLSFK